MLSKIAKTDLAALRSAGYSPTDEQIVQLNDIALRIERGKETTPANMPRIAVCGNVVLHEPTMGALQWWENFGKNSSYSAEMKMLVYYWTLAFANEVEYLNKFTSHREIWKEVKKWGKKLTCTEEQLWKGLLWVKFGGDHDNPNDKKVRDILEDDQTLNYIWSMVLKVSSSTGVKVEDLMSRTQTELSYMLVQSYIIAHIPIKQSVADDYIAYRMLMKKIEESSKKTDKQGVDNG